MQRAAAFLTVIMVALVVSGPRSSASPAIVKWSKDAQLWAPALLQIQARHLDLRPARLRIYADPDYRATVPRWQERAKAMVAERAPTGSATAATACSGP